jgi:hypothetical protein
MGGVGCFSKGEHKCCTRDNKLDASDSQDEMTEWDGGNL